jgi:LemA protein
MSTTLIVLLALGAAILGVVLLFIGIYNRLVALRQTGNQAWADVDVQLKQRHDLVPNLVETVKGYAGHEKSTLDAVIRARNSAVSAQGPEAAGAAEGALSGALRQLFALSEAYPDLKANTNFLELQRELSNIESKIAAARRFFNNAVAELNTAIEQFPAVLIAGMFGFKARGFFEVQEAERAAVEAAPAVKF